MKQAMWKKKQFWESWAKSDLQGWSWPGRWLWGWCALLLVDTLSRRHRPPFCSCRRPLSCRPAWSTAWEVSWKDQKAICCTHPWQRPSLVIHFFCFTLIMSNENCSETSWHTQDLNIVNKWTSWRWDMWKYCREIEKFSSTCGSSLQGDHMINNSQWLLKNWRQSQLEDAGEADMEKQIFHLCNSNTFWEMKKTFLLKVHVFFLAKRNSWRNIIARVVTGDKLWLEKNCKVYLDSDLPHLLAGGAPDLGCCLASLPKTIFA